eukprot:10455389-Ditylum_brightwellii.AAC.1
MLVNIDNNYITYTTQLKYFGSIISGNLDDKPDLENWALQARKAFQAMLPKVFWNPFISLKAAMVDWKNCNDRKILSPEKIP